MKGLTGWLASVAAMSTLAFGSIGPAIPGDPSFRAIVLLERRPAGSAPRVRFEWSPRSGAVEYLLTGSWTAWGSWTVQSRVFRVTRRTATSWDSRQIAFEVSVEPGSHSWKLAPVEEPNGDGQPAHGAQIGFDLR
jgi:hypothetical protein